MRPDRITVGARFFGQRRAASTRRLTGRSERQIAHQGGKNPLVAEDRESRYPIITASAVAQPDSPPIGDRMEGLTFAPETPVLGARTGHDAPIPTPARTAP